MITQSVSELVSQLITQSEDRIYFPNLNKKKTRKNYQSLLQVSDCRYNVFIIYPKILDSLQLCSSRKFHTPSPHGGQFCLRPHPPEISILGDVCHCLHPPPGIPTQSKLLLHHTIVRKIIVYTIKQRKNFLFILI